MGIKVIDPSIGIGSLFPPQWKSRRGLNWTVPGGFFGDMIEIIYPPVCIERTPPSSREVLCDLVLWLSRKRSDIRDGGNVCIEIAKAGYAILGSLHRSVHWHSLGLGCCRIRCPNRFSNRDGFPAYLGSALRSIPLRNRI
jgi:hypothetical protein